MNNVLTLWKLLFGSAALPNDLEAIGVDPENGNIILYDGHTGEPFTNGLKVSHVENERRLTQREHIVVFPLQHLVLARATLKNCITPEGSTGMKEGLGRQKERLITINNLVGNTLEADPNRPANELVLEGRFAALKEKQPGTVAAEHHILTMEPGLRNSKGHIMTVGQFEQACHVLQSSNLNVNGFRKHLILFGRHDDGRWQYAFKVYAKGGKKVALQAALDKLKLHLLGQSAIPFQEEVVVDDFNANYDRKIPISF